MSHGQHRPRSLRERLAEWVERGVGLRRPVPDPDHRDAADLAEVVEEIPPCDSGDCDSDLGCNEVLFKAGPLYFCDDCKAWLDEVLEEQGYAIEETT